MTIENKEYVTNFEKNVLETKIFWQTKMYRTSDWLPYRQAWVFFEDIYWKSTRWFPKKNSFIATYKAITVVKIQFFCEIVIITICLKVKNWEYMRQIHNVRSVTLYKYVNGFWYTLTAICKSRRIKKNITTCRIPQAQRGVL